MTNTRDKRAAAVPDSVESIAAEAKAIDSLRMKWRAFDKKAALALRRRIKALHDRIERLREQIDPDGDPDHDELHEYQEPLSDAAEDVRRSLRSLKLSAEADTVADDAFLDWLQSCASEGLPLYALRERATRFFGESRGRAERLVATYAYFDISDRPQRELLFESAAAQGDSDAAATLMHLQPSRRDHWLARALELRHQVTCLKEGIEHIRPPRTPERLARAAELLSWVFAGPPGLCADEAYAYLRCLRTIGWVDENAPTAPADFRCSDLDTMARVRKLFGL